MTKVTEAIAERTGIDEPIVDKVMDDFQSYVKESLKKGEEVRITDFAVFDFVDRPERVRRNPRTGQPIVVPPERAPKIRFSKNLEDDIQPETMARSVSNGLPPIPAELKSISLPPVPPELDNKYYLETGVAYSKKELKKLGITANTPVYDPEEGGWKKASSYFPDWF